MGFIKQLVSLVFLVFLTSAILGFKMYDEAPSKSINYEVFVNEIFYSFIKEVNQELGFKCIATGGSMPKDVEKLTIGFLAHKKATIEEARELEITLIENFLSIINAHEKIRPYLREYPFTSSRVHISVDFYNKNNEPETVNSISRVWQVRNKIYYDIYNPKTFSSEEVAEELYEEALKIVQEKGSNRNTTF